ncbi:hypothetical protein [Paraburkholderia sp. J12]|uniref:hypothetical protein n=1 Tax=Paraburkholderia sp. J12 TaxID=2805432 RepID=UPI002ABE2C65|nr:hypothetical protein [Paraburkholderia sp. J12]
MRYLRVLACSTATFVLTFFFTWLYGLTWFFNKGTNLVAPLCALFGVYGAEQILDAYFYIIIALSFLLSTVVVWGAARFITRKWAHVK